MARAELGGELDLDVDFWRFDRYFLKLDFFIVIVFRDGVVAFHWVNNVADINFYAVVVNVMLKWLKWWESRKYKLTSR